MGTLIQDSRYGLRVLRNSPGFTAVAVLTLALGIGATVAVFSLVDAVLLRAAPYKDSNQLVLVWTPDPRLLGAVNSVMGTNQEMSFEVFNPSAGDFYDLQSQNHSFTAMAMFEPKQLNLTSGSVAVRVRGAVITGDFFSIFGVAPELGRPITSSEDQPGLGNVAVISHALWAGRFSSDPSVLGRTLLLNSKPYQVIGVMPVRFEFPHSRDANDSATHQPNLPPALWIPFAQTPKDRADHEGEADSGIALARLRAGVTLSQAQTEAAAILDRNRMQHAPDSRGMTALITPLAGTMNAQPRKPLLLLLAAAALVLLIACSNVAGLLLARAVGREHEITVREALGAQRSRLVRQLLTESLLLAVVSGALGVGVAYSAVRAIAQLNSGNIPRVEAASVNSKALLFTLAISLLTSILFGLAPALAASRTNLAEMLAQSGRRGIKGSRRVHQSLIVAEMGLCIVLLAASGLLIRSLLNVNRVDKGFEPQATLAASIALDERYTADKPEKFFREVSGKVAELPGVRAVAVTDGAPLTGYESIGTIGQIEGHAFDKSAFFESRHVTPDYFDALGVPVLEGRSFTQDDVAGKPSVVIVSRSFARRYFPDSNAVSRRIYPVNQDGTPAPGQPETIVGVVSDVREWSLEQTPVPQVYKPLWQSSGWQRADVVVRTAAPPADLPAQIRDIVQGIDPAVAVAGVRTMSDLITSATSARRFQTVLLVSFAGIALFLALVGLYALMAYSVRQRTYEIGIRMALGAERRDVLRLVLRDGLKLALAGALMGLAGSLATARLIERFLFGVKPLDPPTLTATVALLVCASLLACMVPARRATRVDPMVALRHE